MDSEFLKFQVAKIKQALTILKKNSQNLMAAVDIGSPVNPNEYGHLEGVAEIKKKYPANHRPRS